MIVLELIGVALFGLAVWDVTVQTGDYDRKLLRDYLRAQKLADITGQTPPKWDAFLEEPVNYNVRLITKAITSASAEDR
ncbi:MAG: hypothetical protein M1294_01730 [Firmicutes bacterium]|jgi:hypothetical protein|uniref:Uncharacterized protein n=1 Tax=Sulfobacillus benefaciens TaxID=453960 RepID=A0A2T2WXZ5_9FIRM|nr:hypothetical protein [Bacillota bacterium]PSR27108.1 MAG: hypothetical protein C7B43_12320 [Sulfobacillus benefaciens]HBQ94433.1 hypothetical protein [Sulfobacillus sp.]